MRQCCQKVCQSALTVQDPTNLSRHIKKVIRKVEISGGEEEKCNYITSLYDYTFCISIFLYRSVSLSVCVCVCDCV